MKTQTETQTKHTPGPWTINPEKQGGPWYRIEAENGWVAQVPNPAGTNAALIAAAPELLEALKWASERVAGRGSFEDYMKCQRAIAKAEGMEAQAENLPTG